ncbi:MAG: 2-amino-4-hydroxy-6-hydroxymethyldihydropteridine diphosphokinase [Bacteroidetes bacterium]|nr:2-amino-4-hydroxy-6-hydroxymethyldihydropteridine diphosphokinase [Bacteroidota bacterium]
MLQRALDALGILPGTSILRCSRVYETAPWGYADQEAFYNCVVALRCALPPRALLAALHAIERELGRERRVRYGPRSIDLDILLYGDDIIHLEGLTIPHPSMAERNFVLQPLQEIAPDLRHPAEGLTIMDMATRCTDDGTVLDTGHRLEADKGHDSTVLPALFAILRSEDVVADATEEENRQ